MSILFRPALVCGASLAVLAAAMPAVAQTATDQSSSLLESVTVTAQKRAQNPVEVPMALTAYNGDFLQKVDLQELDKLSLFVPGFEVQNQSPNNPGLVMRGLNLDSGEAAQEPRVSVFEDDVSIATTRATYIELFDIDRVEVARGPQTTLFGRSALMGGVNIIQNKAKLDGFSAGGTAEFGDYEYRMIDGYVNVPVSDTVAVRLAGRYKERNGYVDDLNDPNRPYDSVNTMAGRLSLTWKPNEKFSLDLIANAENDRPTGTSFKSGTFLPANDSGTVIGNLDYNSGATLTDSVAGFEGGKKVGLNRTVWDVKGLSEYKLNGAFTLSNVTAYRRFDSLEVFDPDGFRQPMLQSAEDERGDQFSHETRLNFDNGGRLSAFAGVSYFYSNVSQSVPLQFDELAATDLVLWGNPSFAPLKSTLAGFLQNMPAATMDATVRGFLQSALPLPGNPSPLQLLGVPAAYVPYVAGLFKTNHWEESTNYGKTKAIDLYADATYKLLPDLEVEGGVRYTHDDKQTAYSAKTADTSELGTLLATMENNHTSTGEGIMVQPTTNNGDKVGYNFGDDGLSWRFSLRYALEENTSIYATYARGRRPKVESAQSPLAPYTSPYYLGPKFEEAPAEEVDSYEAGLKTAAFNNTLRLDTAFYFYDYDNFQSTQLKNQTFVPFNAGKAEAYGFEGTADWALTDKIDFFGTLSASRARFVGDSLFHGNQFRLNPDVKFSLGASLRQELLGGTFNFLPTYTWQSKIFFDDNNDIASEQNNLIADTKQDEYQNAYGLLNLRLSYQPDNWPWTASVFATNVLDKKFIKDAGNSGDNLGIPTFIAGEPRFFGASLSFRTH